MERKKRFNLQDYRLESEKPENADYRGMLSDRVLVLAEQAITDGWVTPSGEHRDIIPEQKEYLLEYKDFYRLKKKVRSNYSVSNELRILLKFCSSVRKPFSVITEADIRKYLTGLKNENKKDNTIAHNQMKIKHFFTWFYRNDQTIEREKGIPKMVSWMECMLRSPQIHKSELVTLQDVFNMVNCACSDLHRLIPVLIFETGCRVSEFLNIKMGQIQLEGTGDNQVMYVDVDGKTGKRRVFCKHAIPYYQKLLVNHPYRNIPMAPLIVDDMRKAKPHQMTAQGIFIILKTLAKRCNISGKRINPHAFRKARATELASYMTEPELRIYFGWERSSSMPCLYVYLNSQNVHDKLKRFYGIKIGEQEQIHNTLFKPKTCLCGAENEATSVLCGKCSRDLRKGANSDEIMNVKKVLDFGLNNQKHGNKLAEILKDIVEDMKHK